MERRGFLLALAAGTLAGLTGCELGRVPAPVPTVTVHAAPSGSGGTAAMPEEGLPPAATAGPTTTATPSARATPTTVISRLPGSGSEVALTIDDGTDSAVVAAYARFARDSGVRLTFFLNAVNPSWTDNAALLRPLVESGQVQFGNHTWSHPDLRTLTDSAIATQLEKNERFVKRTYGVSTKPFLRPPYGFHDKRVDRVAADQGYPVITLWWGSLGDSAILTPAQILANAHTWLLPQRIVIGHANHPAVTEVYEQLLDLIRERRLRTVTLNDVFATGQLSPA
ncbi:MAG: polysaccharide deacetylase family protein [Jatrophihabitans sp.]|nr:MAG: polysaccharide deacetylase family protein [Jatrophihabitans sp.]